MKKIGLSLDTRYKELQLGVKTSSCTYRSCKQRSDLGPTSKPISSLSVDCSTDLEIFAAHSPLGYDQCFKHKVMQESKTSNFG